MDKRREQDEISQLLDSFQEDNTLQQKMNRFEQNKERSKRLQDSQKRMDRFEKKYTEEVDVTQVLNPISQDDLGDTKIMGQPQEEQEHTMVWNADSIEKNEPTDQHETVVIDDHEIQSLLEEDQQPVLKREVVHKKGKKSTKTNQNKKKDNKVFLYVILGIVGIALVGTLVFGVVRMVSNATDDKISEKAQKEKYEEMLEWAKTFDKDSSSDIKKLIAYEKVFNQLSDKQQDKINEVLKDLTGSNYNRLLAKAKSSKKENSKNNNTEVAEQKAELKEELSTLKEKLKTVRKDYDKASAEYNEAANSYNGYTNQLSAANNAIMGAKSSADSAESAYKMNLNRIQELQNIPNDEITEEQMAELEKCMNQSKGLYDAWVSAQDTYQKVSKENDVQSLSKKQSDAKAKMDAARQNMDSAQNQLDALQSQIDSVQSQLDALND